MREIKVLGTGCSNCKNTAKIIEEVAREKNIMIAIEKVEDIQEIMSYNILATPAVVIDGAVVHAGGVPTRSKVETWF